MVQEFGDLKAGFSKFQLGFIISRRSLHVGISSCDQCKNSISGLAKKYAEGSEELIKTLKGDTFCEYRLLNLGSDEKIKECQDFLEIYIPNVLLSISEKVAEDSHLLCYDLYDEICPLDADLVRNINNFMIIGFQAS